MSDERPMIGISRRVVLSNKEDITFQVALDPQCGLDGLCATLDMLSDASDRERWKADLAEKRQALRVAEQQYGFLDQQIQETIRDRAAAVAGFQAADQARNRRSDFAPTKVQQQAIAQFDARIAAAKASQDNFRRDKPIIEWEIDCLLARIAGAEEPPKPEEAFAAIREIAA